MWIFFLHIVEKGAVSLLVTSWVTTLIMVKFVYDLNKNCDI